ncbi:hypothetical protein ABE236_26640 [Priestia endophytica]|uniref:hypothetical protein n=1 Tax=Priestia endophytica TaxID=135735 RepID=UPI003D29A247
MEMFIQYDEYELLELFQGEPVSVGDDVRAGILMYVYEDNNNFKLMFTLDVYRKVCTISITYKDYSVFDGEFLNITEIHKRERDLTIRIKGMEKVKIKFFKQLGVELL